MVISPAQLVDEPLKLDETIAPGAIEYAPDIRQVGPLTVKGQAELIVEHRGPKEFVQDIRLRATFSGRFEQLCARCLEPVEHDLEGTFDLIFRPGGVDNVAGEHSRAGAFDPARTDALPGGLQGSLPALRHQSQPRKL